MNIRPIHPFPARMAPELAIARLKKLPRQSLVLDPMVGSGTVIRQALKAGHRAIGFDLDPLAVLMSKVWTSPSRDHVVDKLCKEVLTDAKSLDPECIALPWIDTNQETREFITFWFGEQQRRDLRRLSYVLAQLDQLHHHHIKRGAVAILRLALSRLIIVKESGASLARDVSHSRPHKVAESSTFDVFSGFERAVKHIRHRLQETPLLAGGRVSIGDARSLKSVSTSEVDSVLTSPPYLNAIDYMRGHRLSLVWLGYRLTDLRSIRSNSIGAERGPDSKTNSDLYKKISAAMVPLDFLSSRHSSMVIRYAEDIYRMMAEISRVLKPTGKAILVVGNSCLQNTFVQNSSGVAKAASMVGLRLVHRTERALPSQNRYLPIPTQAHKPLGKRMRTEVVLTFKPL
jgi:tRNA G10  N-methylase Trm11